MDDADLVSRLDALGPVPDFAHRPAGATRLLALRVMTLLYQRRITIRRGTSNGPQHLLLARDLGSVLLACLSADQVAVDMTQLVAPGETAESYIGVVSLAAVTRLLPPALATLPPPQTDRLPGALGMRASLVNWAMAAELHRLGADADLITAYIAISGGVEPSWIEAYPDLVRNFRAPPLVINDPPAMPSARPEPAEPPPRRRRVQRAASLWVLADEASILERLSTVAQLKDRKATVEPVLTRLACTYSRQLPAAVARQADAVEDLIERFPNFEPVCRWVADQVRLCALTREPVWLPPTLLLGPPGIGKTMFCIELAGTLRGTPCVRSMAELSASWLITGSSTQWNGGRPGVVADHLSRCEHDRVPWFVFDELDKATGDRGFPLGPALLGLLEPYTAKRFRDEALEIEMDIRPACFIFTANDLGRVRPELVSRLNVIEVRAPTSFEMPAVVASVDAQLRKEQPKLAKLFAPLSASVLLHLDSVSARELRRVLRQAYANAARRDRGRHGKRVLLPTDVQAFAVSPDAAERVLH